MDLKTPYEKRRQEIEERVLRVLASGQYIGGEEVHSFEEDLARFTGCPYALTCSSGTQALLVALMALDVGPGDEVITSPFTFIASAEMIHLLGAKPVYADICPQSFHIHGDAMAPLVNPQTKVLLPVSLYGQVVDMDSIHTVANSQGNQKVNSAKGKDGLFVLEDAAQSLGATYKGTRSGNLSTLAITSFYPTKPLGACGDGGAIFTSSKELYNTMRMIRDHGSKQKYQHPLLGVNARLDAVQCAILSIKLKFFEWELEQRNRLAKRYQKGLSHLPIILPKVASDRKSSWAQYTIRVEHLQKGKKDQNQGKGKEERKEGQGRDALQKYLHAAGIPTGVHYPFILPEQAAYGKPCT